MISVIIPVFNRPEKATRAVRTVQMQRQIASEDIEIILVDDASVPSLPSDHSDPRVRVIRLEKNSGPAAARNAGIQAARGDYIAFLDSDDAWLDDKLARQLAALKRVESDSERQLHALVCSFYYPNRATGLLQVRVPRSADSVQDFAGGCWFCPGSALLIARSAFDIVGLLDEKLRRLEDLDWFVRFGQRGGKLHVMPYLGVIIAPSNSASSKTVIASSSIINSKFSPTGESPLPPHALRRLKAYLALERAAALLPEGKRLKGAMCLAASFLHQPRIHAALERFWERRDDVPASILATYAEMERSQ